MALLSKSRRMLQNVCRNCVRVLEEEKHRQPCMFVILWKKWKKVTSSSINQSEKAKYSAHTPENIAAMSESVREAQTTSIHRRRMIRRSYFQMKLILIMAQKKLLHLKHIKPTRMRWRADAPKTSHRLVWILA